MNDDCAVGLILKLIILLALILTLILILKQKYTREDFITLKINPKSLENYMNQRKPDSDICPYFKIKDWNKHRYYNKYRQGNVFQVC